MATNLKEETIRENPSLESQTEFNPEVETEEMTEEQGTTENVMKKPIRELSPAEKRKLAVLAKTRAKTYEFVTIPKAASWEMETSLEKLDLKQVKKYKSNDLEWKMVLKAVVPHIDQSSEVELRFTPKQGDKLQRVLELGYTHVQVSRNDKDGTDTNYEFVGLD